MAPRVGTSILRGLLLAPPPYPDVLIGAKHREPEFGCLCANGPVGLSTRCVFYTPEQTPPIDLCDGTTTLLCVPALPVTDDGSVDFAALRDQPIASLLGTTAYLPRDSNPALVPPLSADRPRDSNPALLPPRLAAALY
jgi:hypothetical protein